MIYDLGGVIIFVIGLVIIYIIYKIFNWGTVKSINWNSGWDQLRDDDIPNWVIKASNRSNWPHGVKHFYGKKYKYKIIYEPGNSQGEVIEHYYKKRRKGK